jgi:hypothetical protein
VIVTNQNEIVGAWISSQLGKKELYSFQSIGLEKNGELIAGVLVDSYKKNASCSIHCAGIGKRWLNREFLFVVFDYVFRQLGCKVVINPVDSANTDSVRFTTHIGFKEALRIEGGCGDSDLLMFTLRKEDCRWLKGKK